MLVATLCTENLARSAMSRVRLPIMYVPPRERTRPVQSRQQRASTRRTKHHTGRDMLVESLVYVQAYME